jgi:hypothetical protein
MEPSARRSPPRRLTIFGLMALVAAAGVGLWLVAPDLREGDDRVTERFVLGVVGVLGGISLLGPVFLIAELLGRRRRPFGPGEVVWFSQGMASWLLWPPVVYNRLQGQKFSDTLSGPCYYYGTPLMAIFVTSALLAGGWIRPRRRGRARRSWREQCGLLLGLAWACTGFYVLYQLYKQDFKL